MAKKPSRNRGFRQLEDRGLKRLSNPGTIIVQNLAGEVYIFPEKVVKAAQVIDKKTKVAWQDSLIGFAYQVVNLKTAILVAAPEDKDVSKFVICRDGR